MFGGRKILWLDCTAALIAGVLVLAFSGWLSRLHGLPQSVLLFVGMANLVYAAYSSSLARQRQRPLVLIKLLVCANALWSGVCLALLAAYWAQVSLFAVAHLLGEAVFVAWLAAMEWRQRFRLAAANTP